MEIPGHQDNEVSQGNNTNMDPDNDDTYVIKFRLSDIGRSALKKEERSELKEDIYQQVTILFLRMEYEGYNYTHKSGQKQFTLS